MEGFMNEPENIKWNDEDIIKDLGVYNDKTIVAKRYNITVKEITEIIRRHENVSKR